MSTRHSFSRKRIAFWAEHHRASSQGTSPKWPAERALWAFRNQKVLEIGAGRQTDRYRDAAYSVTTADITEASGPDVLIESYDELMADRFDLICFWYVLHHVTTRELPMFAGFVLHHLYPRGYLVFNAPDKVPETLCADDGIGTTPHSDTEVRAVFSHLDVVDCWPDERQQNYVMRLRR